MTFNVWSFCIPSAERVCMCIKLRIEFRAHDTFCKKKTFTVPPVHFESFSITIQHKLQQQHNTPLTFKRERWDWIQGHCNKKETSRHVDMWDSLDIVDSMHLCILYIWLLNWCWLEFLSIDIDTVMNTQFLEKVTLKLNLDIDLT